MNVIDQTNEPVPKGPSRTAQTLPAAIQATSLCRLGLSKIDVYSKKSISCTLGNRGLFKRIFCDGLACLS